MCGVWEGWEGTGWEWEGIQPWLHTLSYKFSLHCNGFPEGVRLQLFAEVKDLNDNLIQFLHFADEETEVQSNSQTAVEQVSGRTGLRMWGFLNSRDHRCFLERWGDLPFSWQWRTETVFCWQLDLSK